MKLIVVYIGLITFGFSIAAEAAFSEYTSVKVDDCITLDSAEFDHEYEIDYYEGICRGKGPYTVKVSGGDLRYGVGVLYRGKPVSKLTNIGWFHDLGSDVVEWRYAVDQLGRPVLRALIFRISAYENDKDISYLHVVKLDKQNTCTVEVLRNQGADNEKARSIAADIDSYSCL